jgi:hypothetical protein
MFWLARCKLLNRIRFFKLGFISPLMHRRLDKEDQPTDDSRSLPLPPSLSPNPSWKVIDPA